jgi:hypothetical protein
MPLRAEARFLYRLADDDPTRGVPPWVTTAGETTEIATVLADATRRIGEVHGRMHDRQRALDHEARVGRRRREARPRLPGRGRRLLPRRRALRAPA